MSTLRIITLTILAGSSSLLAVPLNFMDDFTGGVSSPNWSTGATDTSPSGEDFLGRFINHTETLSFTTLDPGAHLITLSFDLYLTGTWDGNHPSFGPDHWKLDIGGGATLLDTTFSNANGQPFVGGAVINQAFPGNHPGGDNAPWTGTSGVNTLGYAALGFLDGGKVDSTYSLTYQFVHTGPNLDINFSASNLEGAGFERWGLDNVSVASQPVPDTGSTLGLFALGLGLLRVVRKRK